MDQGQPKPKCFHVDVSLKGTALVLAQSLDKVIAEDANRSTTGFVILTVGNKVYKLIEAQVEFGDAHLHQDAPESNG